jgi:hypothetical protein
MNTIIRIILLQLLAAGLTDSLRAQTLTSLGAVAPTPGTNDISQLSTQGNTTMPAGINYYTDNGSPVGQTFTTGTNAMRLTSLAIKTAGLDSGLNYGTPANTPTYYLRIYSISGNTATFLIAFSAANPGFTDGDWLKWSGLNVPLAPNRTYAYTFGRQPSSGGYAALAVATNKYAGGRIVAVPSNGGTITTGSTSIYDAVFSLGLRPAPTNPPASMPFPMPTYGWNFGNTLESTWGVPSWTPAPFYTAANAGFNAVRIPVSWDFNSTTNISGGGTNYVIKPAWMAQVKKAVDSALDAGMYVVMNDHWDGGWLDNVLKYPVDPVATAKMNAYWTQIATTFAGYDNRLVFAAANEPPVQNTDQMKTDMYYYQTFVNAVRRAGGYNTNRWLVIQSVSDPTWMNALPTDTVTNRIMVEYHQYTPTLFTIIHDDPSWGRSIYFWGKGYHYSGNTSRNATWGEEYDIDSYHQQLADLYVSKGIPVMIGEFGAYTTYLTNATEATWNRRSASYWNKYAAESARGHGLSPFYWSTPNNPFDWNSGAVVDAERVSVLLGGAAPPPPNGAPYAASGLTATGGVGQVIVNWTAGSGATSYNLYRAGQSGDESKIAPIVTGIIGTSYTNNGLNAGITYYYQLVAVSNSITSGFSPEAHATTSGTTDTAQFNFEGGTQGWTGGGGIVSSVATSAAQHFVGNQSLAINFNGGSAGTASPSVGNVAVAAGATITFHVWIPIGSKVTALQPYIMDHNNTWASSWYASFTAGAWNTLTLTVPANAATPLNTLGIQFFTSGAWTGTCYLDSVSLPPSGPDFNLSANPTSLTVNSGTNGASSITVTPINGLNAVYTLSASNLPAGVTATFAANPMIGGATALTLTASNTVASGTSNVSVIVTAGLISHTTAIALTLNAAQPPVAPTGLAAVAGSGSVALSWSASPTATSYYVKRSTMSGAGYINIATNASLGWTNTGLANGTMYYFVVSGVNAGGEGTNSLEVSARPTSFAPTYLGLTAVDNQLQLNWPPDHTGWLLQAQTNSLAVGLGTNWSIVAGAAETNQITLGADTTNGAVFFRLVRP